MTTINEFMAKLPKLSPAQLQATAQANKDNAIFVGAVLAEKQRREKLDLARRATGQEQPKVVDEVIASMAPQQLPEDMGIARIPAGDMNFAGGGIIAFADGGDVERYQYGGMPKPTSMMGDIPGFVAGTGNLIPQQGAPEEVPLFRRMFRDARAAGQNYQIEQAKARIAAGVGTSADEAILAAASGTQNAGPSPQDMAQFDAASNLYMTERANKQAAAAAPKAAPTADTGRKAPGAGLGAAAAAAAPKDDPFSMASIKKAQTEALGDSNYKIGELNNQLVDIRNKAETQVQQRLDDRKKEIEAEGDVYKDRSDRLVERAKSLAGQKDQNTGLALLNAGLAIMSTPGGLATAIGKGAQVGTAQYAAGIKDLRAAQERLDEANDRISELRMNRKDLNSREIRALEKDRDAAILDGQKMVFGFAKDVYGMDRKQAEAAFTSYMSGQEKKAEIQSRERTSKEQIAAANRTPAEIQMVERVMKEKNIPFTEALALLSSSKREGVSEEKLRGEWLDTAKRMQIAQDYPNVKTFEDYKTVMGMGGGGGGFKVVGVR